MTKNQPVQKFRFYDVTATVWENQGENGTFYTVTTERTFRDKDGAFKSTHSYSGSQLVALIHVADLAHRYIGQRTAGDA
jgi:hypothetical protein